MSPGRYEDAESVTSFGATWVDADHCAEVDAGDPSLAAAMATTNDSLEQVPDIEDPLAAMNRNTSAAPICRGEGGQGEGVCHPPPTLSFDLAFCLPTFSNYAQQQDIREAIAGLC